MMMALDVEIDFGVVIGGCVRILLAGEGKNYAGIFFAHGRQVVAGFFAGDFDASPFAPQIDSSGGLDHFVDVSAADASSAFQKIKLTVGAGADEFCVGDSAQQAKS